MESFIYKDYIGIIKDHVGIVWGLGILADNGDSAGNFPGNGLISSS